MDFELLANASNKEKLAIIVVGYNRLDGISRLLNSIESANYDTDDVPLVISIDASGNQDLYDYVNQFEWSKGSKYINIQNERLGLRSHIFQCASLTRYFKGVIILEDDLFVSPCFYHYCKTALEKYGDEERVSGISLYAEETNGYVGLPFQPVPSKYDVYAWQTVCSWGEIWNERMWRQFSTWFEKWDGDFESIDMIGRIKRWTRAWSKYFYAYIITNDKYFIYPYQSLSTNFNDAGGEHGGGNASIVQVALQQGKKNYQFGNFDELIKYDVYGQNMDISVWLNIDRNNLTVDFFGLKDVYKGQYVVSPFTLPYEIIQGFSLSLRPWELNIKYKIQGEDIFLYKRNTSTETYAPNREFGNIIAEYYLRGFNSRLLFKYVKNLLIQKVKLVFKTKH